MDYLKVLEFLEVHRVWALVIVHLVVPLIEVPALSNVHSINIRYTYTYYRNNLKVESTTPSLSREEKARVISKVKWKINLINQT